MATDWILGGTNPWRGLFDAGRTNVRRGIWNYITENADYPYYLVRDRFAGRDGTNLRSIPRGEGRVIDLDGQAAAVYRAIDGSVTRAVGRLHPHGMPGALERGGTVLGLPVSRVTVCTRRGGHGRSRGSAAFADHACHRTASATKRQAIRG